MKHKEISFQLFDIQVMKFYDSSKGVGECE
jgi:hypothetical protein